MKTIIIATAVAAAALLVSCAQADPTESDEYIAATAEASTANSKLTDANAALADAEAATAAAETEITELTDAVADAEAATETAEAATKTAEDATAVVENERDAAVAEVEALRLQYDPEIRAGLQAAVDGQIAADCLAASEAWESPIEFNYSNDWSPVIDAATFNAAVEECAAPARSLSAEERDAARFAAYEEVNVDALVRDPASYNGRGVVMHVSISQFDVATGKCSFQGNFRSGFSSRSYEYDERGRFGFGSSVPDQIRNQECPPLDGIDQDDFIKVWVTGIGVESYSTTAGGNNTIPAFSIDKVELVEKS